MIDQRGVASGEITGRKLKFRLGVYGLHVTEEDSGNQKVGHHAVQFISYEDLLAKAEKQMTLF